MLAFAFLIGCLLIAASLTLIAYLRVAKSPEILYESHTPPPFLRPFEFSRNGDQLSIVAPVVRACLMSEVLVLSLASETEDQLKHIELGFTGFQLEWLNPKGYSFIENPGMLLLGPKGEATNQLLREASKASGFMLPEDAGNLVQAFPIMGLTLDPAEDLLRFDIQLPSGLEVAVHYAYSSGLLKSSLPIDQLLKEDNYQALGYRMAA